MRKSAFTITSIVVLSLSATACAIPLPLFGGAHYSHAHRHYDGADYKHRHYERRQFREERRHSGRHGHQ